MGSERIHRDYWDGYAAGRESASDRGGLIAAAWWLVMGGVVCRIALYLIQ